MNADTFKDLLTDEWVMPQSQLDRVILLAQIQTLYEATQKAGWHEHTADWDWRLIITLKGGEEVGTTYHDDCTRDTWADTFAFDFSGLSDETAEDFTACVDYMRVTHIHVEIWGPADDEPHRQAIHINQIQSVRYEEA